MQEAIELYNAPRSHTPILKKLESATSRLTNRKVDQLDDPPSKCLKDMRCADDSLDAAINSPGDAKRASWLDAHNRVMDIVASARKSRKTGEEYWLSRTSSCRRSARRRMRS